MGYSPWGRKESDTTGRLTLHVESKKMIQMNLFIKHKQTYRHRRQNYDYQRGKGVEEG